MNCITEIEKTEEILKQKWNSTNSSEIKDIIMNLFVLLKERQCVTSAAFQAIDRFDALKHERDEIGRKDKLLFRDFTEWLNSGRDGEKHKSEELSAVMTLYDEVVSLTLEILSEWEVGKTTDKNIGAELRNLNSSLSGFPQKLQKSNMVEFGNYKWPVEQSKRVSKAVEFSYDQMERIQNLIKKLKKKHKKLDSIFKQETQSHGGQHSSTKSSSAYGGWR